MRPCHQVNAIGDWGADTILGKAHPQTAEALDTDIFFARPYRSCERGLNEHTNGLLRQFVPQTENLRTLDPQRLQEAINRPNHRTPYEVFRDDRLAAGIDPPAVPW